MAKRFTDTEKYRDPWFMDLSPTLKLLWLYICDNCDSLGVFKINVRLMEFETGAYVDVEDLKQFGTRLVWISEEKVWLPKFIPFQYGNLSPRNAAHRSIMNQIIKATESLPLEGEALTLVERFESLLRPSTETPEAPPKGPQTLKVKEKVLVKEKVQEEGFKKGGVGENNSALAEEINQAGEVFRATLRHFNAGRTLLPGELADIGRAIQAYTFKSVCLALEGMRHEPKSEGWDPSKFVSLGRVFKNRDAFTRFLTLGVQAQAKNQTKGTGEAYKQIMTRVADLPPLPGEDNAP